VVMRLSIVNIFLVSDRPKPMWHRVVFIPHVDFSVVQEENNDWHVEI
jgi:hypothetical protein